jgi:hypothetical protein
MYDSVGGAAQKVGRFFTHARFDNQIFLIVVDCRHMISLHLLRKTGTEHETVLAQGHS